MNGKFDLVEISDCYFHYGFPLPLEERHKRSVSLRDRGELFCRLHYKHAQVFAGKNGAQSRRDSRVAGNLQGPAPIDGSAQIAQKCYAGWACLDMFRSEE